VRCSTIRRSRSSFRRITRRIGSDRAHQDRPIDAPTLAYLLRADLIPDVQLPDEATWERRKLVTYRRLLLKRRTTIKSAIHSQLNQKLLDPEDRCPFTGAGRAALAALPLGELDRYLLDSALLRLDAIDTRIESAAKRRIRIAAGDESVQLLMTVPGVGTTVAVGIAAAIVDVRLFSTPVGGSLRSRLDHRAQLGLRAASRDRSSAGSRAQQLTARRHLPPYATQATLRYRRHRARTKAHGRDPAHAHRATAVSPRLDLANALSTASRPAHQQPMRLD